MPLTALLCSFSHSYLPQDREAEASPRGKERDQRPILAMSLVTMLSERVSCCFAARSERREVLSAVSRSLMVALISDAEQALPALIFEAHLRASAMVVILTRSITSSTQHFGLDEGRVGCRIGLGSIAVDTDGPSACVDGVVAIESDEEIVCCDDVEIFELRWWRVASGGFFEGDACRATSIIRVGGVKAGVGDAVAVANGLHCVWA